MLSDEELRQKVLEAKEELKRAGITIDLEAEELAALPAPSDIADNSHTPGVRRRLNGIER
jgi:hypothetical protein